MCENEQEGKSQPQIVLLFSILLDTHPKDIQEMTPPILKQQENEEFSMISVIA
jgi:hypothetical protein